MELNFFDEFKNYSTLDLLLITKEPEKYQPEATAAAEKLLRERNISIADIEGANHHLLQEADAQSVKLARMDAYREQVVDVFEPVLVHNAPLNPAKWFKLFLVSYGLIYAWALYTVVKTQLKFLNCKSCKGDITLWGGPINAIFLTIVFYFLLENKRWGWILLMASNIVGVVLGFVQLQLLYKYRDLFSVGPVQCITPFVIPVLYVLFLWRPAISEFFKVDVKTKHRTTAVGLGAGLLYCAIVEMVI